MGLVVFPGSLAQSQATIAAATAGSYSPKAGGILDRQ